MRRFLIKIITKFFLWLPDGIYIRIIYFLYTGKILHLRNPQTFSEKLQWLKIYDHKDIYTTMVDKYEVKDYVAKIIGYEYIIPTLDVWNYPEEIEWEKLPEQFVLKTTMGGGSNGVIVCKNKEKLNKDETVRRMAMGLKQNIGGRLREWPYINVKPRVIAEKYLDPYPNTDLLDYKFFCFNGAPQYCQVISGRGSRMCVDFFDRNWCHQPFHEPANYPFSESEIKKPVNYEKMLGFAELLSKGIPFLRVDMYENNGQLFFGELTFFPTSGMGSFSPNEYNYIFGNLISLPLN